MLTATPDAGSVFTGWSGLHRHRDLHRDDVGRPHRHGHLRPAPLFHRLTVTKAGAGTGTVTSAPAGITCGATCAAAFASGTPVTLTATPAPARRSPAGAAGLHRHRDLHRDDVGATTAVTAPFDPVQSTFHHLEGHQGRHRHRERSHQRAGRHHLRRDLRGRLRRAGRSVTLTATPGAGSTFTGWSGGGCTGTGACTVTMDQDVTATFDVSGQPGPASSNRCRRFAARSSTDRRPADDRKIERAIQELEDSLDPRLWLDDSHLTDRGKRVFREEREAANKLSRSRTRRPRS